MAMELRDYFIKDLPARQRQYEAIRAIAFNEGTIKDIAGRFSYTPQTLRMLINRLVRDKLQLFPDIKKGPKGSNIPSETEKDQQTRHAPGAVHEPVSEEASAVSDRLPGGRHLFVSSLYSGYRYP